MRATPKDHFYRLLHQMCLCIALQRQTEHTSSIEELRRAALVFEDMASLESAPARFRIDAALPPLNFFGNLDHKRLM